MKIYQHRIRSTAFGIDLRKWEWDDFWVLNFWFYHYELEVQFR